MLERAGVVRRSRSQGDRRRTYLRLGPGVLELRSPVAAGRAARVVFVCTENSARSQLAAALWSCQSRVPAASAGTRPGTRVHPAAVAAARRHDMPMYPQIPRQLGDVLRPGDFVVTVCDNTHEELDVQPDWLHWSVADPVRGGGTDDAFDQALLDLTGRIHQFAPALYFSYEREPDD